MQKHFVTFYSPGTIVAEETTKEIDGWDIDLAVAMSHEVIQRYRARPYGFRFTTRERGPADLDSKATARSGMYYLGCDVLTLEQIKARNDPSERVLLENMVINGWDKVVTSRSGWRWTLPLEEGDVVLS